MPTAFISYSHESEEHKSDVFRFYATLRTLSVDASFDQNKTTISDMMSWMRGEIEQAEFVLIVCSPQYRERAERRDPPVSSGAAFEGFVIDETIYRDQSLRGRKFLAILFPDATEDDIPAFLRGSKFYRIDPADVLNPDEPKSYESLLRSLFDVPEAPLTPLASTPPVLHQRSLTAVNSLRVFPGRSVRMRDEYDSRLAVAERNIDILGWGLRAFREDHRQDIRAWSERGVEVRILVVDPDSEALLTLQDELELQSRGTTSEDVMAFLAGMMPEADGLANVQIRLVNINPATNVFRIDDAIFWGPYLAGSVSRNSPTILSSRGDNVFGAVLAHFEVMWRRSQSPQPLHV